MGNEAEEDQSSRTGGIKNSVEFIKLPILTIYSNFEERVRSRTSFLFFPSTRVCRSVSYLNDQNELGACQYLYLV